jgi:hypothetical protein
MTGSLTYDLAVIAMMLLAILTALVGIYGELRKIGLAIAKKN